MFILIIFTAVGERIIGKTRSSTELDDSFAKRPLAINSFVVSIICELRILEDYSGLLKPG